MDQLEFKEYEVYQGDKLIDYWCYKEKDQASSKKLKKKINKKMNKLKINDSARNKQEQDQIIDKILSLCI